MSIKQAIEALEAVVRYDRNEATDGLELMALYSDALERANSALAALRSMPAEPVALKVINGEICFKSQADDQSYGMWCPVHPSNDHNFKNGTCFYATPHTAPLSDAWQPIDTAPKDGTAILVSEGRFIHCVEWNDEYEWWAVDDNKLGPFRLRGTAPTHWQPLPPPPIERAVLRGGEQS